MPDLPESPNPSTPGSEPASVSGSSPGSSPVSGPGSKPGPGPAPGSASGPLPGSAPGFAYGEGTRVSESFGQITVDVDPDGWLGLLESARAGGYEFFDWLTAVDEPPEAFAVVAHLFAPVSHAHLLLRTRVSRADPRLPSAVGVFRGADWHERETFEMFGVVFEGHPNLVPLLLPEGFEGFPLRKDFVLAARVAKAWPGAKEPGESGHGSPSRRKTLPPGVPADWGRERDD
ncbi:NADH-quinone oxidoreductase subunit C [Streptosporangium sp. NPDC006930]|uniref:NADH-quinone oxidoreductase subunit C n=1 Tax=Streptosporangium sp. NPDC006930 TaxID=3154783 RepID=UPI0034364BB7